MIVIVLLIYLAYFIFCVVFDDLDKWVCILVVYNIFVFVVFIFFIYVIFCLIDSLYLGVGGNFVLGGEDLDNIMWLVFYLVIIGWIFIGLWMVSLFVCLEKVCLKWFDVLQCMFVNFLKFVFIFVKFDLELDK